MPKRTRTDREDEVQAAFRVVSEATDSEPKKKARKKNPAAVALGRLGGKKGGKARAEALTAKQRSDIARKAAEKRWGTRPSD